MMQDSDAMQLALKQAQLAYLAQEVPVGAVVIRDDQVLGVGFNQPIGHSDPTAHAEIMALRSAALSLNNYRLTRASLYVTLEPCTMCLGAMVHSRIERLVYGAKEPKSGVVHSHLALLDNGPYNHRVEVVAGVLAEECSALLRRFFAQRREKHSEQRWGGGDF